MTVFSQQKIARTAFGEQLVAQLTEKISVRFDYNINARQLATAVTGTGTVTQSDGSAVVGTGTTTGSDATMTTVDAVHYDTGIGVNARFTALYSAGVADTVQRTGIGDSVDGFHFGCLGVTFGIFRYRDSVEEFIPKSTWNVDKLDGTGPSGMTLDPTKGNVFQIEFQYLGYGEIEFFVESDTNDPGFFTLVHRIDYANTNTETSVLNPTFHMETFVDNDTTTSNVVVKNGSFAGFVEGIDRELGPRNARDGSQTSITTTETNILTIRNKATYQGVTNRVPVHIDFFSASTSGNKIGEVNFRVDATFGDTLTYADVDTNTSVIEFSTTAEEVSLGVEVFSIGLGSSGSVAMYVGEADFLLTPGHTITISGFTVGSGSGNDFTGAFSWKELF